MGVLKPTIDDIAAVIVTRGDVDLSCILETLPYPEIVVWNNSTRPFNCGVLGRYLAILETTKPIIYTQDDDCIFREHEALLAAYVDGEIIGNMPASHWLGHPGYTLLGWGSLMRRDLPWRSIEHWLRQYPLEGHDVRQLPLDVVVAVLTPSQRVDLGHEEMPWKGDVHRTHRQAGFQERIDDFYHRAQALRQRVESQGHGYPYAVSQEDRISD